MKKYLLLILIFNYFFLFSQAPIPSSLEKYRNDYIPEKVFVHTDKNIYAGGEVIWMAVYLVDGQTHLSGTLSNVIKVELRNSEGKVISSKSIFSDKGHAACDIALPTSISTGNYQLVAYTNYQKNTGVETLFRKTLRIIPGLQLTERTPPIQKTLTSFKSSKEAMPTVRFFPEGGDCVDGIPCRVAYVAENITIQSQNNFGHLVDQKGKELIEIKPNKYGIGKFTYLPKKGEKFWLKLQKSSKQIELPAALESGYHLSVRNEKDTVRILIKTKLPDGVNGSRLVMHARGHLLVNQKMKRTKSFVWVTVPKNTFVRGVVICTLFDKNELPVAERLFFVAPSKEDTQISIKADTTIFGTRENIQLKINTPNNRTLAEGLQSKISLSVIPAQANQQMDGDDIRTWLLLNSDIDVPIPYAPELFDQEVGSQDKMIDDFLLTRGWRRFRWETIRSNQKFSPEFVLEKGIFLRGKMSKYINEDRPRPGKVFLSNLANAHSEEVMTDEKGYFEFGPYALFDTVNIFLEGRYKNGKKNRLNPEINIDNNPYVTLKILEKEFPKIPFRKPFENKESIEEIKEYVDLSQDMLTIARNYDSLSIILDEIEIQGKRISSIEKERQKRTPMYISPSERLIVDSIPGAYTALTLFDLIGRLQGVFVSGGSGNEQVLIRGVGTLLGGSSPLYVLDGFPVDADFLRAISVSDIDFIDVLKGSYAAIYGVRGANGVILVYTKTGGLISSPKKPVPGLLRTQLIGFHKAREFAVFDPTAVGNSNRPDIRTTIHWNPDLRTDSKGEVWEIIKTSDQTGSFIIVAQGLRADGQPLFGTASFEVEE